MTSFNAIYIPRHTVVVELVSTYNCTPYTNDRPAQVNSTLLSVMAQSVERVLAAAVEGQAESLRYIERQLSSLHATLTKSSSELQAAIKTDTKQSTSEVELQYTLTLENVVSFFSGSNFDTSLQAEYHLARSENAPSNRAAAGTVYIIPSKYNLVYSCVTAVAAAVTAGNCVVLEVSLSKRNPLLSLTHLTASQNLVRSL